ncbi:ParA family protein [Bacteroides sp.]|uniref:ParA family protein n=1 Tax=Bacteroides sp. TaxID=29523 RepID=UPI003AAAC35C
MKTITTACVNHKGGVAKTTSLLNLAAGIARLHGKKVCIIDADPQANTTMAAFGEEMASLPQDVMLESVLQEIMQDRPLELKPLTWLDRVDVLPASLDLAATEVIMNTTPGREFLFREIIRGLEKKYDHILIDCPPSLGIITQNALMASDFVIIPTDGNYFAMKGIEKIHYIISLLRRKLGAEVRILGYFMTKYNAGRKLDVDIRESLIETLGESVFETTIRNNVALGEAQYNARSIFDYAPSSNGARDYRSLTEEFLKRIRKMNK